MRYPSCNHDNPDDASFCEECGAKLALICPACKVSVHYIAVVAPHRLDHQLECRIDD
jgi:Double zinc ribbon